MGRDWTSAGHAQRYGNVHQRLRRRWAPLVAAGGASCSRCDQPIHPGQPWDLGHTPGDRHTYAGPQHSVCNRNTTDERGAADPAPKPRTQW
jgi:hypothetical protein